ncbi:MAG: diguanylate cyclase [Treponema sp.]|nr:diguanylate cyclase [Treponema sp.]
MRDALQGKSGSTDITIRGEHLLVNYSQNALTGWVIITEKPYASIWRRISKDAVLAIVLGGSFLLVLALTASLLSEKATAKIRTISSLAAKAAEGSPDAVSLSEMGDDELCEMAMAINKIRSSRDTYRKDAEVDKLTGLLNKVTLERSCRRQLSTNVAGTFSALLIIDLDHFKRVNDTLGHQTGDALLHDFGEVLRRLFRPGDLVGRFGGDEFVVFLNDLPGKEIAFQKARRILEAAASVLMGVQGFRLSASIGIASSPLHGSDYDTLFAVADRSVYKVKESCRNGICYGEGEVIHQ